MAAGRPAKEDTAPRLVRPSEPILKILSDQPIVLDAIDHQLLGGLQRDGRASYAHLGAAVGLSDDAVRERLKRLCQAGILQVVGVIEPAALGYRSFALVGLRTRGSLTPVLQRLLAIAQIDFIVCTAGGVDVLVEIVCKSDVELLSIVSEHIKTIPGVEHAGTFAYLAVAKWAPGGYRHPRRGDSTPEKGMERLDELDRALMRHLQQDGRAGYQELATKVRQPYGVVRRRVQQLLETGVVQIVTVVNRLVVGPQLMAGIAVRTEGPLRPILQALAALPEVEIVVVTTGAFDLILEVACRDKAHLVELVGDRLRTIPGIRASETFTYLNLIKLPMTWAVPSAS